MVSMVNRFSRWAGRKRLKPIPQKRDNESEIPKTLSLFMPQISDKEDHFFRFSSRTNAVSFTNLIGLLHGLSRFILEYHKRSCVEHRKFLEGGWIFIWIKENILESRRREFIKHVKNSSLFYNLFSKTLIYTWAGPHILRDVLMFSNDFSFSNYVVVANVISFESHGL